MLQKLTVNSFEWRKDFRFYEEYILNYDENIDKRYMSVLIILRNYRKRISDLSLLLRMNMNIDNIDKLMCNLYGKKNCAIHITMPYTYIMGYIKKRPESSSIKR